MGLWILKGHGPQTICLDHMKYLSCKWKQLWSHFMSDQIAPPSKITLSSQRKEWSCVDFTCDLRSDGYIMSRISVAYIMPVTFLSLIVCVWAYCTIAYRKFLLNGYPTLSESENAFICASQAALVVLFQPLKIKQIEAGTKWPLLCRWLFQLDFLVCKLRVV